MRGRPSVHGRATLACVPLRRLLPLLALALVAAGLFGAPAARAGGPVAWCGSGEPTTDQPDAVSAFSWHVVYATPSNGVDRFASYAPRLAGDVQAISNWWLGQDATRKPRFDLLDAPSCGSEYGRLDISFLRLPQPAGAYSFEQVVSEVSAAGFDSPDKGYLVYVDDTPHAGDQAGLCGQGSVADTAFAYTLMYLQACGQSYSDDVRQLVATHEMVHGLGAVYPSAPHYCSDGHVCDSPNDLMKAVIKSGDWLGSLSLDVGRDDYYGHQGTWWDTRDSLLLYRFDEQLPPPPAIAGLTATSLGGVVIVDWSRTQAPDGVSYRVYGADGNLLHEPGSPKLTTTGAPGETLQWTIRSVDDAGWLGAPATLRFKVGYGIVDAGGALLKDTVAPASVTGLRAARSGRKVVLRWRAVSDPIGIRGYRITAPGLAPRVVRGTSAAFPLAKVRGKKLQVRTVDEAGNLSRPVTVRVAR